MKKRDLDDYKKIYKFTMLSDDKLEEFYVKSVQNNKNFHQLIMEYVKKNVTIEILKRYLKYNSNGNIKYFFAFLNKIEYILTIEDAEILLKEEIFQNIFMKKFGSKKAIYYEFFENYCNGDENLSCLVNLYLLKNNILLVLNDSKDYSINKKKIDCQNDIELIKKYQAGHKEILEQLIVNNIGLVRMVANKYHNKRLEQEDLVQEGCIGLLIAIDKFDVTKGFSFSTYAIIWIRQVINRAIEKKSRLIRFSVNMETDLKKYEKISQKLWMEFGREPTEVEIAKNSNSWSVDKVKEIIKANQQQITSIDQPITYESDCTILEFIPDHLNLEKEVVQKVEAERILSYAKELLTSRDYEILRYRMGFIDNRKYTLDELVEIFDVTRSRIAQIEEEGIKKIKDYIRKKENYAKRQNREKNKIEEFTLFSLQSIHKNLTFPVFKKLIQLFPKHEIKLYIKYRGILLEKGRILSVPSKIYPSNFLLHVSVIENDLKYMFMCYEKLVNKEKMDIDEAIYKIKNEMHNRLIRFRFSEYSQKQIYDAVLALPEHYKEVICLRHGNDLTSFYEILDLDQYFFEELNQAYFLVEENLKANVESPRLTIHKKSLRARYSDLDFQNLDSCVKKLSIRYQEVVYLRNGKRLNEWLAFPKDGINYYDLYTKALNRLDKIIRNSNILTLINEVSKKDLLFVIPFLTEEQKNVLYIRHGEYLDNVFEWPEEVKDTCIKVYDHMKRYVKFIIKIKKNIKISFKNKNKFF